MIRVTNRQLYIIGLITIILVSALYYTYFKEAEAGAMPTKIKHLSKFALVAVVYGIGTYILSKIFTSWMMALWHLIYIGVIIVLLSIGFYYWWEGDASIDVKRGANTLYEFLISPVLYVAMGIFHYRILRHRLM